MRTYAEAGQARRRAICGSFVFGFARCQGWRVFREGAIARAIGGPRAVARVYID